MELATLTPKDALDAWGHARALAPLAGAWFAPDPRKIGGAALALAGRRSRGAVPLRHLWPELVPGFAAMDRLASLMVDALVR